MMQDEEYCPVAYDHTDGLDECAVCGWGVSTSPEPRVPTLTGTERVREAINRLSGRYAPIKPVIICDLDNG